MFALLCQRCKLVTPRIQISYFLRYSSVMLDGKDVPVIKYPLQRRKEIFKSKAGKKKKAKLIVVPRPGKLLISTNERRLNLYTNEFPTRFEPPVLSSQSWTSTRSSGRYFVIHSTKANPSLNYKLNESIAFQEMGLSDAIVEALKRVNIHTPTCIQTLTIPEILSGSNVMITSETGSGKTHGYLLPVFHKLLETREESSNSARKRPNALILTPSRELSSQVKKMGNALELPLHVEDLHEIWTKGVKKSLKCIDVLSSTPVLILQALKKRFFSLEDLDFVVVDECDTLLDESFSKYVCNILGRINIRNGKSQPLRNERRAQLILCSATFPDYAEKALEDIVSLLDVPAITTGYMHRISPHNTHKFLRLKPSEKFPTVLELLRELSTKSDVEPAVVFCNMKKTAVWLAKELIFHGLNVDRIDGDLDYTQRIHSLKSMSSNECNILICTDLSSRGLDTQRIRHVINYDFPSNASDYIHRSGRVGRVGQQDTSGKVTSLISRPWEIPLVMKIEEAARRRERIEGVSANIKSYHNRRWDRLLKSNDLEL